ncbi:MAG TPA: pyridoxamine 5'-phosphate oxidase family protein [bacterium]|nr:pyridoxamine 5'-phosphate oxidase family protein [bacterium]
MRRKDREITDKQRLQNLVRDADVCRVAFLDTPFPYVLPFTFVYLENALYMHIAPVGRKLELIRHDPHVAWEVDCLTRIKQAEKACGWGCDYESVVGTGIASVITDETEKRTVLIAFMAKYSGRTDWTFTSADLENVSVLKIAIEDMTGKSTF